MSESRFLVVARCGMDDLPLGLFATRIEAKNYVNSVDRGTITGFATSVFKLNVSVFCNIGIVEFKGWLPVAMTVVRDLEDDESFNLPRQGDT